MKRIINVIIGVSLSFMLGSWGKVGHKTVAFIAERHLTTASQIMIRNILGDTTLDQISSWADSIRKYPKYRSTASWHFLNLPDSLDFDQFSEEVFYQKNINVYLATLNCIQTLKDTTLNKDVRKEALMFLVHFIGDMHQPMHISRKEDKGGNTIQLRFYNRGTNLHALWDSELIEKLNNNPDELAKLIDRAKKKQIRHWQKINFIQWMYESYEISQKLYAEINKGDKLSDDYYNTHIKKVELQLEKAGVRLASVLNAISEGK